MSREIDALVAEKVMGWSIRHMNPGDAMCELWDYRDASGTWTGHYPDVGEKQKGSFHPSTRMDDAWKVVEKMRTWDGCWIEIGNADPKPEAEWFCKVSAFLASGSYSTFTVREKTAARAICLAALKVESKEVG